jgi:hypothetical protein
MYLFLHATHVKPALTLAGGWRALSMQHMHATSQTVLGELRGQELRCHTCWVTVLLPAGWVPV